MAFDSVVHSKLIVKLQTFSINGVLLIWITAFLHGRSQCVFVENHYSSWSKVYIVAFLKDLYYRLWFSFYLLYDISNITVNGVLTKQYADDLKFFT